MRQKKKLKKALSLLLTAAMVLSLNVPVFADEADDGMERIMQRIRYKS